MELLRKLSEAHGVPGYEDEVRSLLLREFEAFCDSVEVDALGNLIARKGSGEARVMLAAHMDEIGLMVKHVDSKGYLRFMPLGGVVEQCLLNQRVLVHTSEGVVRGVIGSKPPHLMKDEERKKPVKTEDMFIDVGAGSAEDAEKMGVRVGDFVTFERSFAELGGELVTGKAFDDRIGCWAMVEVMRRLEVDAEVYAVATVQEEVGLKGARTSAYGIAPDMALVLETTSAGDFPGVKEEECRVKLGAGVVVTVADAGGRGLITHPRIRELLVSTAREEKIEHQLEVVERGTTDATSIHLTRTGVPTGVLSVPARYLHSPVEVADRRDMKRAVELCCSAVRRWCEERK